MASTLNWVLVASVVFQLCAAVPTEMPKDPEAGMRSPEIIKYWGYPCESHNVTTEDGYILTMHRIPHGKDESGNTGVKKPVVFLQHGLLASDSSWIANLPNLAFGYLLADNGYDVWMGNVRGNVYSTAHATLDPVKEKNKYWDFSWDEMAKYDLPAMVDKALQETNHQSLYYVGHSQGTLIMFTKLAGNDPVFNKKIRKFFALAPVCTVKYIEGLMAYLATDLYDTMDITLKVAGNGPFATDDAFMQSVIPLFCDESQQEEQECGSLLLMLGGNNSTQLNDSRIPVFMSDEPGGTSLKNMVHWAKMVRTGTLTMFDYEDALKNLAHYGQTKPPVYDIGKINADVRLYWSPADWLADEKDIRSFLLKNINPNSLKENNEYVEFEHMDFIWGQRAKDEVYKPIVMEIQNDIAANGDP